ncbi:ATP-binding Cassette (ABC) Superfamily, partial [Aphelenchoides avenae]
AINPESHCSVASSVFFCYAGDVIRKGYDTILRYDDVWAQEPRNRSARLRHVFSETGRDQQHGSPLTLAGLFWRLLRCNATYLVSATVLAVISAMLAFCDAVLLRSIISSTSSSMPMWYALLPAIAMCLSGMIRKLMATRMDYNAFTGYYNIRSIFITAIYDKMLRLTPYALSKTPAGKIMNHATADVQRIRTFWSQIKNYFQCLITLVLALVGLFYVIGRNTLYGVTVLVAFLPINYCMARLTTRFE